MKAWMDGWSGGLLSVRDRSTRYSIFYSHELD
jgi:hypothetical protein